MFFFEKKNQKTFALLLTRPAATWAAYAKEQKFFASFFQKRSLLTFVFLTASCADEHHVRVGDIIPTSSAEHLEIALPPHWVVAQTVRTLQLDAIEMVPDGQSRARWTDMLTIVWIDRAMYHNLSDQSAALTQTFEKRCAGRAAATAPEWTDDGPYHLTMQTLRCARSPEGFAHVMIVKTIKGHDAYYQVQRAWRLPAGDVAVAGDAAAAAARLLAGAHLVAVAAPTLTERLPPPGAATRR
jgi:hypothetical protein